MFTLLGAALIPYAGVQNDEALFAAPLYEQMPKEFCIRVFHHTIPLMVMSYVGNLKTLLYLPIFHFLGSNLWTIRFPMVLAGAITVFIFYKLLAESVGRAPALIGAFLLASDPSFILTNTYDWGPVALEHLLLVTACFFLLRFFRNGSMRYLAAGFFFLGLGLWNKAIFLWALSGLGVAGVAVFHRQLVKLARPRAIAIAAAAFLIGALPFVIYNIRKPNATLGSNAHFDSPQKAMRKMPMMIETLNGHGLFGFLCRSDWEEPAKHPGTIRGRLAWRIADAVGGQYQNGFEFAFLLCLACAAWWWRRRSAWFSLIFIAVTWTAMLFSRDAGGSVHHTVLVWPFPQLFMAVALASLPWPRIAGVIAVVMVGMNLLVMNQYIAEFERNGAAGTFDDAVLALAKSIPDPPRLEAERIYILDWGMLNTLALFHQGRLPLFVADPPFLSDHPAPEELRDMEFMLHDPQGMFLAHVPAAEVNRGVGARFDKEIAARGLEKRVLRTVYDSNGRPMFKIFKLQPATGMM
ncbi:MAG TPA: glycosyltransferase family 39 protein [Bryobacteraceae bacterium]|nr:glycosyltransferase family 39 protein [Bryobacteraceae bacterium]